MKKQFGRLASLALALVLALSLCVPAFAAEGDTVHEDTNLEYHSQGLGALKPLDDDCSITLTVGISDLETGKANDGDIIGFFKVVDITYDAASNVLHYAFTPLFQNFQNSDLGSEWSGLQPEEYGKMSETEIKPLLGAFTAFLKAQDDWTSSGKFSGAAMGGQASVTLESGAVLGQFIAVGTGTSQGPKIYQTVTINAEPVIENGIYQYYSQYAVAMKTSKPSVDKDITAGTVTDGQIPDAEHQDTASIGDKVSYILNVNVPVYPEGATNKTFYLGDTLSKGLTLVTDEGGTPQITVTGFATSDADTGDTLVKGTHYEVSAETNTETGETRLYVDFYFDAIFPYHHVTVSYDAVLNENVSLGTTDGNPNNVDLIYSNSPFDGDTWKPGTPDRPGEGDEHPGYGRDEDKEIVYTYALVIDKFEEKHEDEKLSGAVFELYDNEMDPILDKDGNTVTLTTDANGAAKYVGLEKGTYHLKEVKAPTGFNIMEGTIDITIDASCIPYFVETEKSVTHYTYTTNAAEAQSGEQAKINGNLVWMNSQGEVATGAQPEGYEAAYIKDTKTTVEHVIEINKDVEGANGYYKAGIANGSGVHLPSTGGAGTTLFYVVGSLLVVGAAVLLVTKRRMDHKKSEN